MESVEVNGVLYFIDSNILIYEGDKIYNRISGEITEANDEWSGETDDEWVYVVPQFTNCLSLF